MGRMLLLVLAVLVIAVAPVLVSHETATQKAAAKTSSLADFHGVQTMADIAKLSFVHKSCRKWAADGDIDIDETCLVVPTAKGSLAVIPNEYADAATEEAVTQPGRNAKDGDKWLARFYAIRGGKS